MVDITAVSVLDSSMAEDEDLMDLRSSAKNHFSFTGFLLVGTGLVGGLGAGVLMRMGTGGAGAAE